VSSVQIGVKPLLGSSTTGPSLIFNRLHDAVNAYEKLEKKP